MDDGVVISENSDWIFVGKEEKYAKYKIVKNEFTYYIIIEENHIGETLQIFEKPDLINLPKEIHASGAHLIINNPKENHYDHFYKGKEWKERGENFEYPFWYSNNPLGL